MSTDRENAIKILSSLSPSIREAIAVFVVTTEETQMVYADEHSLLEGVAKEIRSL